MKNVSWFAVKVLAPGATPQDESIVIYLQPHPTRAIAERDMLILQKAGILAKGTALTVEKVSDTRLREIAMYREDIKQWLDRQGSRVVRSLGGPPAQYTRTDKDKAS